jgi:pyruvate dehydrogenase E2 component (dihydrolipoamide acetyltransferase)
MAEIIMPKMGDAMSEGKVVRWYKKAGEPVKKGEPVLEIETDKVNLDLEAEQDGTIGEVSAQEGQMVPIGGVLATIVGAGEAPQKSAPRAASGPPDAAKKEQPAAAAAASPKSGNAHAEEKPPAASQNRRATDKKEAYKHSTGEYAEAIETRGHRVDKTTRKRENVVAMPQAGSSRRRSSPLARRMARDLGVSLDAVEGSGPSGRIVASDIQRARSAAPAVSSGGASAQQAGKPEQRFVQAGPLEDRDVPLTAMRRTIAKRLAESTGPIPHFYLTADYDVTTLLSLREQFNQIEGVRVSVNDFIVRAAALAIRHHPSVNSSFSDEAIHQHGEIHIGIAVSTPEGLITPVIRNADEKSIPEIAEEVRTLAEKAKNRKLKPDEYQGSTFTISNLGAWGIEEFTAIINPPNVAILAVGAASQRPVVFNGQVVVRDRMKITMSCDHRVVDGAAGADFLKTLRQYLEQPLRLVV